MVPKLQEFVLFIQLAFSTFRNNLFKAEQFLNLTHELWYIREPNHEFHGKAKRTSQKGGKMTTSDEIFHQMKDCSSTQTEQGNFSLLFTESTIFIFSIFSEIKAYLNETVLKILEILTNT